ncbi:MAG: RDD family protein [Acidimicrobiia bacterium]|nr:RDD family protein [Acidimicrobiia bacterium]
MAYQTPQDPTAVMGKRVVAFLIDLVIGAVLIGAVFLSSAESKSGFPDDYCDVVNEFEDVSSCMQIGDTVYVLTGDDNAPLFLVSLAYGFGIFGLMQGLTGASIGKHIMGLRVVKADGTICGVGRATGRWAMFIVDAFFCFLVGLITVLVTRPHRRVGDFAAGTFVVGKDWTGTPIGGATWLRSAPGVRRAAGTGTAAERLGAAAHSAAVDGSALGRLVAAADCAADAAPPTPGPPPGAWGSPPPPATSSGRARRPRPACGMLVPVITSTAVIQATSARDAGT